MSTGAVIAIVVVIVVVIAALAVGALEMRRRRLRRQFGPEYDRVVSETGNRRKAEAELAGRQRRVAKLDIRPLTAKRTPSTWASGTPSRNGSSIPRPSP